MCNERFFFFNAPPTTPIYTLSLHDALPISILPLTGLPALHCYGVVEESEGEFCWLFLEDAAGVRRSEEHTSELQSRGHLVCRLLLEKKKDPRCEHTPILLRPRHGTSGCSYY